MPTEQDYMNFFKEADADGSGELTLDELKGILRRKGYSKSDSEIKVCTVILYTYDRCPN